MCERLLTFLIEAININIETDLREIERFRIQHSSSP